MTETISLEEHQTILNKLALELKLIRTTESKRAMLELSRNKKAWFKMIANIDDPAYCEALIIQLEAKKHQLSPTFTSHTPDPTPNQS